MMFVRFVGLMSIGLVAVVLGGMGSAAAAPRAPRPRRRSRCCPRPAFPSSTRAQQPRRQPSRYRSGHGEGRPQPDTAGDRGVGRQGIGHQGQLTAFERDTTGTWKPIYGPMTAYLGSKGIGRPRTTCPAPRRAPSPSTRRSASKPTRYRDAVLPGDAAGLVGRQHELAHLQLSCPFGDEPRRR